jgi:hypothetical protein
MEQPSAQSVREFLSKLVPTQDSADWATWKLAGSSLGPDAAPYLLEFLRGGDPNEQYAAVVTLRLIGYEAWADGFGRERTYRVRKIGATDWEKIVPSRPPENLTPGHDTPA